MNLSSLLILYAIVLCVVMFGAAILMAGTVCAFGFSIWLLKVGLMAIVGYIGNMMAHISHLQVQLDRMLSYAGDMDGKGKDMFEEDEDNENEDWKNGN